MCVCVRVCVLEWTVQVARCMSDSETESAHHVLTMIDDAEAENANSGGERANEVAARKRGALRLAVSLRFDLRCATVESLGSSFSASACAFE